MSDAPTTSTMQPLFVLGGETPWEELGRGVRRQMLGHVDDLMMVRADFEAEAVGPVHHHPHRQASYVVAGRFRVSVGDDVRELKVGDCFLAVADMPHGVVALEAGTLIDVFTPTREDFLSRRD